MQLPEPLKQVFNSSSLVLFFLQEGKDAGTAIVYVIEQLESVFLLNLEVSPSQLVSPSVLLSWKSVAADFGCILALTVSPLFIQEQYSNLSDRTFKVCNFWAIPHTSALRFPIERKVKVSQP